MNRLTADESSRLFEAAKLRAQQLRGQAVEEFWACSGQATRNAVRSAQRLASSLARHAQLRGQS